MYNRVFDGLQLAFFVVLQKMASMVEFQDFKLGQHMFPDTNDLQAFEEWLSSMDFPTPPLSPDPTDSTATNTTHLDTTDDIDVGETILQHMIESENVLFDSQSSNYGSEDSINVDIDPSVLLGGNPQALLQDCMWNSDVYEQGTRSATMESTHQLHHHLQTWRKETL